MSVPASRPDAGHFTTDIDNPFFTLRAGTTFVYENKEAGESNTFTVTHDTAVIDGVTCVVVHDIAYLNGQVIEDTIDWFAQDDQGNVWYFGEDTHQLEPGNPVPIGNHGSWVAGVNGAEAGIAMLANPEVGDHYQQEFSAGIAEDNATVTALNALVHVGYGSFGGSLQTLDVNPLDPSQEDKFYAEGVGNVLTSTADGDYEALVKVIVEGTSGSESLLGYAGGDSIFARGGNDRVDAGGGNDSVLGGGGADILLGGDGFDVLNGGRGSDRLSGGAGGDTFVFSDLSNGRVEVDVITDYRRGQVDVIDFDDDATTVTAESFVNGAWELTLSGDGDHIRLLGVVDTNHDGHIVDQLIFG